MAQRDNLYQPGAIAPGQPQQHHPAACRDALYHQTSLPKALDCGNLLPLSRSQPAGPAPFKLTRLRTSAPQALDRCQNYSSPSRTECARPSALPTRQSSEHARDRVALYSRHPTSPLRTSSRRLWTAVRITARPRTRSAPTSLSPLARGTPRLRTRTLSPPNLTSPFTPAPLCSRSIPSVLSVPSVLSRRRLESSSANSSACQLSNPAPPPPPANLIQPHGPSADSFPRSHAPFVLSHRAGGEPLQSRLAVPNPDPATNTTSVSQ